MDADFDVVLSSKQLGSYIAMFLWTDSNSMPSDQMHYNCAHVIIAYVDLAMLSWLLFLCIIAYAYSSVSGIVIII